MSTLQSPRVALASLALGIAAFGAAIYASMREIPVAAAPTCNHEAIDAELARLRERVEIAERSARRGVMRRVGEAVAAAPHVDDTAATADAEVDGSEGDPVAPEAARPSEPLYSRIEAPAGLKITQDASGAIAVVNDDPALSNTVITVKAQREDGTEEDVVLIVPPPS